MSKLILYGRRECHLCDLAKDAISRLQQDLDFELEERDVDQNPDWQRLYGDEVPVGFVGDRKVFKYRVDPEKVARALQASS